MSEKGFNSTSSIAGILELALLEPTITLEETLVGCLEARKFEISSVCVHPCYVQTAVSALKGTVSSVNTVVGFPNGTNTTHIKMSEAKRAMTEGARSLDLMINAGYLKSINPGLFDDDIKSVCGLARMNEVPLYVIIDIDFLNAEEIRQSLQAASELCVDGVTFFSKASQNGNLVDELISWSGNSIIPNALKAMGNFTTRKELSTLAKSGYSRISTPAAAKILQ